MKPRLTILLIAGALTLHASPSLPARADLAGTWKFRLDPENRGDVEKWFECELPEKIRLPGSLQNQGFGEKASLKGPWTAKVGMDPWRKDAAKAGDDSLLQTQGPIFLTPERLYVGAAWYQREIAIPEDWRNGTVTLTLERPHWKTRVWVDGRPVGEEQRSLGVPHRFDLSGLEPGAHRLTVRVDNTLDPNVGEDAHSVSDQTQGNWNGIVGDISLEATPVAAPRDLRIFPDVDKRSVRVSFSLPDAPESGTLRVRTVGKGNNPHRPEPLAIDLPDAKHDGGFEVVYPLGADARLWDEFEPNLYTLTVEIEAADGTKAATGADFGLREWGREGKMFTINNRVFQLRGTLECAIWPRTGYPPTDLESWRKVMRTVRDFGLNHVRFHSWCPPEAAFTAADEAGIYLQVECSVWSHEVGPDAALQQWIRGEAAAILAGYGNHPSFFAMLIGNEGQAKPGRDEFAREFLKHCRESDGRHLYSDFAGTGMFADVDFAIKPFVRIGEKTELARYKEHLPGTRYDYAAAIAMMDVPLVAHEAVQQAVYPDFAEIAKYSGPLKPHTYDFVRELMKKNGLEKFEREIFMAVGKRQTLLYKSGIESLLRTPDYAGYQLLGINDFSGQGMALVGAVDSFWDVKAYTSAAEYRRFQSDMVPLARFDKYVWTAADTFSADLELAHYGPRDLENQEVSWKLGDAGNQIVAEGKWNVPRIARGGVRGLGNITLPLAKLKAPSKYRLEVSLKGTGRANHWDIWVFPASADPTVPPGVTVASTMTPALMESLRSGGSACLFVDPAKIVGTGQKFSFYGFIWNSILKSTVTDNGRGVLVRKDHPALALFPTDETADWQWEPLINGSKPLDLSEVLPAGELPIVTTLDIWRQARKLGSVFETKLGGGKLLVCTFDLNQPAAKNTAAAQLRRSLLAYAASDAFNPTLEMTAETLNKVLYGGSGSLVASIGGRVKSVSSEAQQFPAKNLIDGKRDTIWHSRFQPEKEPLPHRIVLELPESIEIEGLNYIARQTPPVTRVTTYEIFISANGSDWGEPVKTGRLIPDDLQSEIRFAKPVPSRFIRFDITGSSNPPTASVAELDILFDPGRALNMGLIDPTGKRLDR